MIKKPKHTKKRTHTFKMWNSKTLKNQRMFQYFFKMFLELKKSLTTYKWVIMYKIYEKKL